ncbi:hypothetical protein BYT27DRAFT_7086466 [Phlegmacium glaucopus]|nr:hypothetical protein BYT27DRAFT_7086466 [Phlegmacium glaucopus]
MKDILAGPLTHFFIRCMMLGGSGAGEALDKNGSLKDAKDIVWYHDVDDAKKRRKRKSKAKEMVIDLEGDTEYANSSSESGSSSDEGDESNVVEISNKELAESLPSKTIPAGQRRSSKADGKRPKRPKKRQRKVVDDAESNVPIAPSVASTSQASTSKKVTSLPSIQLKSSSIVQASIKRNPIYHFYEEWDVNNDGNLGNPGDKHYRCYHGNHKIFTVSKAMNYSLHRMVGHIRSHFKPMHDLFLVMKIRDTPTDDEILMASGKKVLDGLRHTEYSKIIEAQATGIKEAFAKQLAQTTEPWNQGNFERLLIEWMITCDQPFDEVEKPEFIAAMSYGRLTSKFTLPKRDGVRRRVMKLGDETVQEITALFAALEGKISLSLDAWTSSNCYAFLAIVAHYITNEGQCGEFFNNYLYVYISYFLQRNYSLTSRS